MAMDGGFIYCLAEELRDMQSSFLERLKAYL